MNQTPERSGSSAAPGTNSRHLSLLVSYGTGPDHVFTDVGWPLALSISIYFYPARVPSSIQIIFSFFPFFRDLSTKDYLLLDEYRILQVLNEPL